MTTTKQFDTRLEAGAMAGTRACLCRRSRIAMIVTACVLGLGLGRPISAQTAKKSARQKEIAKESLVELAPIIVYINRRYPKFYGDKHTVHGDIFERSYLTDNWGGLRDDAVDVGVYLDTSITQNFMSNVHGGIDDSGDIHSNGSLDVNLNFDTTKLTDGYWPGATVYLHGEVRWGSDGLFKDSGAGIPTVYDSTMPRADTNDGFYLSEAYVVQAVTPELSLWIGKMNGAGLVDGNAFANSERTQFLNTALVDNPTLGPFAPYTALVAAGVYIPTPEHAFIASVMANNNSVRNAGFDDAFTSPKGTVVVGAYGWLPEFDGLPGEYLVAAAYSTKAFTDYAIANRLRFFADAIDPSLAIDKDGNYITFGTFSQYLYCKDKEQKIGWGLFARYGFAPKDRNVIDQFYSFGIGGKGCVFPGRDHDAWGIGWAGTHFSADLRRDLGFVGASVQSLEHVIEAFYSIALTPAVHLTLDAQFIFNPVVAQIADSFTSVDDEDLAIVVGTRLQVDF